MFNAKVLEDQANNGKKRRMLTKEHYTETVNRLKMLENISEQRGLSDYNLMRRFALMRVQINDQIVEELVKPGTQLRFISFEELFDIVHVTVQH